MKIYVLFSESVVHAMRFEKVTKSLEEADEWNSKTSPVANHWYEETEVEWLSLLRKCWMEN